MNSAATDFRAPDWVPCSAARTDSPSQQVLRNAAEHVRATALDPPVNFLILGIGNALRGDDGVGPAAAAALAAQFRQLPSCRCLAVHQFAPEHAEDLAHASRAFLIDASVAIPPGKVRILRIHPAQSSAQTLTHTVAPHTLLWMAQELFGSAPETWLVEIGAADFAVGNQLSPPVAKAFRRVVHRLARHIRLATPVEPSSV